MILPCSMDSYKQLGHITPINIKAGVMGGSEIRVQEEFRMDILYRQADIKYKSKHRLFALLTLCKVKQKVSDTEIILTNCGGVTPCGKTDLGQLWLRQLLAAWWHQAITWATVDLWEIRSCDIQIRARFSHVCSFTDYAQDIYTWHVFIILSSQPHLPGAKELKCSPFLPVHLQQTYP